MQMLKSFALGTLMMLFSVSLVGAQGPCGDTVTVVAGDTLTRIAIRCDTTVDALLHANPEVTDPRTLQIGHELTIPAEAGEPSASLAPASGPPETSVNLTASGFPANIHVIIGVGREHSEWDATKLEQTDSNGELVTTAAIPDFADFDERWVFVVTTPNGRFEAVTNAFQVTEAAEAAQVSVSPLTGPPGTPVQVEASGFPPHADVVVGAGREYSEYDILERLTTDEAGQITSQVAIPDFAREGSRWVIVVDTYDYRVRAVSDVFNVTTEDGTEPAPPPDGAMFTHTNIHLIALDDAGARGREIGCNDSVVPVEVDIGPTVAPLTAALETLFSMNDRVYGETDLYNALSNSDLQVEGIDIVAGHATIALSGEVVLGGVCDLPRFRAQLEDTALQYHTIDTVSISINGRPLDEILSQR